MRLTLDTSKLDDYRTFLRIKRLPNYRFIGRVAEFPDEYAHMVTGSDVRAKLPDYQPSEFLFDYQKDIARMAVVKNKYAIFADCGLGKTLMFLDWAKYVLSVLPDDRRILMVSPLMVVDQTAEECERWYGDTLPLDVVKAADLADWTAGRTGKARLGITNFEALREDVPQGCLAGMIVDESSMLKSHYGAWGREILRLGRGLRWKLAGTGTPAPNDRIEYANHAVFLDAEPNVNAFLARYFVNRGEKANRWEIKPHAIEPFYRGLSHWSIFLTNPATYGWRDHSTDIPPIDVHIEHVPLTDDQIAAIQNETGQLFATHAGGIGTRSRLGQIAKGTCRGEAIDTRKPNYIRRMAERWPEEQTIIWCLYNAEQDQIAATFGEAAASMDGQTPYDQRKKQIADFKAGRVRTLITKPRILGFGLNLQCATRQIFSGLQDSYEQYYQAVKRSNRVGSTRKLNVHIPVTDAERPMIETVLDKADRVQADAEAQERIFKEHAYGW